MTVVVDRFYEAAVLPDLWPRVLHETALALGAEGAIMLSHPGAATSTVCSDGIAELIETFLREGWDNVRASRGIGKGRWDLHSECTIFSADELDHIPFYTDLLRRLGFRWFAGTTLASVEGTTVLISIERRARDEPFSPRELTLIESILPHLRRASGLAFRLGLARGEGMLEAFDRLSCGAMLLRSDRKVIRVNAAAQSLLGDDVGLIQGRVTARDHRADNALQKLIWTAMLPAALRVETTTAAIALPRPSRRPIIAYCVPLTGSAQDIFQRSRAVVLLIDMDRQPRSSEASLCRAFGLTSGEARVAAEVGSGSSPRDTAAKLAITEETARTVLKRVFAKVGVSRQSELAVLLAKFALG